MHQVNALSEELARFIVEANYEMLPEHTVQMAKRCLLDALGVSLAASSIGEGCRAFVDLAIQQGGAPQSTIFGTQTKVPVMMAAFANGSMAHALDFEDAHDGALLHPNAPNVPVALAISEELGNVSGKKLITALVVGCEISCRMALALRVQPDDFGWYTPPIIAAYGATATAGYLYDLNASEIVDAFSLTLCQSTCSSEIKSSPTSVVRAVRDAFSAKAAVVSAKLAKQGIIGFDHPLEGESGFYASFARGKYDPDALTVGLGKPFEIDRISFKPWPTCRGTHVYIEAAIALTKENNLKPENIKKIQVYGNRINRMLAEPEEQKKRPKTSIDAKFSIPFTVAVALCFREVGLWHFFPEALTSPEVLSLAQKVHFIDGDASVLGNHSVTSGMLTIEENDGRTISKQLDAPYGNPKNPLTDKFLVNKFKSCVSLAQSNLDERGVDQLVERIFSLEQIEHNLGDLIFCF